MPKKLQDAVKKTVKRHHSQARQRILSFVACILVFCMTYGVLLQALAISDPMENQIQLSGTQSNSNADKNTSGNTDSDIINVGSNLSGIWREDLLSVAERQLGYVESTGNYVLTTDGSAAKGYTLFGDWYGNPYGDWAAMFVSYCLDNANIKNMPLDDDCQHWIKVLDAQEEDGAVDRYYTPDEYTPRPGDLIFFDWEQDGVADHVGIVEEVIDAVGEVAAQIKTIEGDSDDKVQKVIYSSDDASIMGYAKLPVQPYTYSDGNVQVEVTLPEDSAVPRNAQLKVTPIESDSKNYSDLTEKAQNAVNGSVEKIALYDISFYTADQEYIPVDEKAQVTMRFGAPVASSSSTDVVVLHYDDNDSNPVALEGAAAEKQSSADAAIDFETEGFSIFAVVEVKEEGTPGRLYPTQIQTNINANALDGKKVLISTVDEFTNTKSNWVVTPEANGNALVAVGAELNRDVLSVAASSFNALDDMMWVFEANEATADVLNDYYVKAKSNGKYLKLYGGNSNVTLVEKTAASILYVTVVDKDGTQTVFISNNADANHTSSAGRELSFNYDKYTFEAYGNGVYTDKNRSQLILSIPQIETTEVASANVVSDTHPLANRTFVISSNLDGRPYALTSDPIVVANSDKNNKNELVGIPSVNADGKVTVYAGNDALWTFIATATSNVYNIRSVETRLYLSVDGGNNISLSETANDNCKITVVITEADDNGEVVLKRDGRYLSLNLDSNNFTEYGTPTTDRNEMRADLILSEYNETEIDKLDNYKPVTDLSGKTYVLVSTNTDNDAGQGPLQVVSSQTNDAGILLGLANVKWVTGQEYKQVDVPDGADNVFWIFEPLSAETGLYAIRANGTDQYLNITGEGISALGDTPHYINVVSSTLDGQEYIGLYYNGYYLNRYKDATIYGGWGTEFMNDPNSRFVLATPEMDSLVGPENDNLPEGTPTDHTINVVEPDKAPGVKVSLFNYDESVNTDQASGGLANQAEFSKAYAKAIADDQITAQEAGALTAIQGFRFFQQAPDTNKDNYNDYYDYYNTRYTSDDVDPYNFVIGGAIPGLNAGLLYGIGYIYDELGARTDYAPPFAAGAIVFDKALTDEKAEALNLNGAEDGTGFWGWNLGGYLNNDGLGLPDENPTRSEVSVTLDDDGYPEFVANGGLPNGSLKYLFDPAGQYNEANLNDGGGLFQIDEKGYYYYHSEINAAYYDETNGEFVLYDHAVRPNYTNANASNIDRGNFLPFDSLGTVNADKTVNWWTQDGDNNNDLDPTGFVNLNNYGSANDTALDAQHFYWPVLDPEPTVCSAALAETNLVDMWFGMMIEIPFYMPKDGTVNGEDMIFSFSGDDDVLVYVDDVLILNIGGIHGAHSGKINFTKGTFDNVNAYQIPDMVGNKSDAHNFKARFDAAGKTDSVEWNGDRFADYTKHTLKFFYMERGGNISHCGIRFNMPALPENSLTVTKNLDDSSNPVPDYIADSLEYTFRVIDATYDSADYGTSFFKEGEEFNILYDGQDTGRKGTVAADGTFTLKPNESARFTDMLNKYGNTPYMVQELVSYTWTTQYSRVEVNGEEATGNRPSLGPDGTLIYQTPEQIEADETNFVVFSNVLNETRSTLEIEKVVAENSTFDDNEEFEFNVWIGGNPIPKDAAYTLVTKDDNGNETSREDKTVQTTGIIKLKKNQTAIIGNLLAGVTYRVTETLPTLENGTKPAVSWSGAPNEGTVGYNSTIHITATNSTDTWQVEVPIKKTVLGSYEKRQFTFEVYNTEQKDGVWERGSLQSGRVIDYPEPGNAIITIATTRPAQEMPYTFMIVEKNDGGNYVYDDTYYIVRVNVVPDANGGSPTVTITNVWKYVDGVETDITSEVLEGGVFKANTHLEFVNRRTTSVTITKDVPNVNSDDTFNFTVTATLADGTPIQLSDADKAFTLTDGQSKVISGLPIGAIVTVVEEDRLDYKESFTMSATYEAENGTLTGEASVVSNSDAENASGHAYVGNIKDHNLSIPVHIASGIGVSIDVQYAQDDTRSFNLDVVSGGNTTYSQSVGFETTKGWQNWAMKNAAFAPYLNAGRNELVFSGTTSTDENGVTTYNFAPNLDKIHLTFGRVDDNTATINLLGDDAQITFHNEPVKAVTVGKEVEGENADKNADYTFTATIKTPSGAPVTPITYYDVNGNKGTKDQDAGEGNEGKYTFTLKHGQHIILADLPTDAIVQVTENAPGYYASYEVVSRFEAEDAELDGTAINSNDTASNRKFVGNIGYDNDNSSYRSLTFTVNADQAHKQVYLRLCYNTVGARYFGVTVNGGETVSVEAKSTGNWDLWMKDGEERDDNKVLLPISLNEGVNTIVIGAGTYTDENGAVQTGWAPNLDYVEIVWETGAGMVSNELNIPELYMIRFTNTAGVELPETGGPGTLRYTLGGLLLMAVPLLYGCIRKRKREGGAEA